MTAEPSAPARIVVHHPSRLRKLLFSIVLGLGVLGVIELVSLATFYFLEGELFFASDSAQRQRRLADSDATLSLSAYQQAIDVPQGMSSEVIHPYLGFVFDQDLNEKEKRRERGDLEITEHGFFRRPGPPPKGSGEELRIAIMGGSAAMLFSFQGRAALLHELEGVPKLKERGVVVESLALGGYKQPQQLLTLSYFLALGEHFDVVINLDGFNEVVLPITANPGQETFPFFPLYWPARVEQLPDSELLVLIGEIAQLRRQRQERAAFFSHVPLVWSPTAHLLWRHGDRRTAARLTDLESQASTGSPDATSDPRDYRAHGPSTHYRSRKALVRALVDVWRQSSLQMHRLCEANGVRYYHLLQPNQYVPDSKPMTDVERRQAFNPDSAYRQLVEEGYPELVRQGKWLEESGVAFYDLTGIFADVTEPVYYDDCCHLLARGDEMIGALVGREIAKDWRGR